MTKINGFGQAVTSEVRIFNGQAYKANMFPKNSMVIGAVYPYDSTKDYISFPLKEWNKLPLGKV